LSQRLSKVRQSKVQEIARSIGASLSTFVIAAAVATAGFWTYQLMWSVPQPLPAVAIDSTPEAEQQRLAAIKEAEQRQAKTADLEAKLRNAEAEQQRLRDEVQRQTKSAADVETRLKAAEAEQQRLREEMQHQGKAAVDLVPKLNAAEAEQQQLIQRQAKAAAEAEAVEAEQQQLAAKVQTRFSASGFTIRTNTETKGLSSDAYSTSVASISDCEQKCARSQSCKAFAYNKSNRMCYTYRQQFDTQIPSFTANTHFDSGVRGR